MRWQNKGSGTFPNLGGFCMPYTGLASNIYYCTFVAKVPKGCRFQLGYNSLGIGGTIE